MSDPLKFSINLEFFKKNDFSGCVHLFQTVRNKKGLRQSLQYLSQGRQILSKRLIKLDDKYFIEVVQLNPKYLKRFQINRSMQLSFPILRLDVRKYSLTDQILSKERMIIEQAFGKMFRKALKKNSKKQQKQHDTSQKINMKHIFTNDQCNRILINNLNKNYIERRLVIKLMKYLSKIKDEHQCNELLLSNNQQSNAFSHNDPSKDKVIYQKQDHCKLEVRLGLQSNLDKPDDTTSALKAFITLLIDQNKSPSLSKLPPKSPLQKQQTFTEDFFKNQLILSQRIHKKIQNYNNFLIHIVENYESSFLVFVQKQYQKLVKLDQKIFSLSLLQIYYDVYILLITSTSNFKTWIFYLSQKLLRNFDYLMFNTNPNSQVCLFIKSDDLQLPNENNIKIKVKPATSLESNEQNDPDKSKASSCLSMKSMKSQDIYVNKKIELKLFPLIFNDQSETFKLCFMKTAFYNGIAIRRKHTNLYLTNLSSKSNPFSVSYCVNKVMMKKMTKCSPLDSSKAQYIYFACSFDEMLNFWRIDIYRQSNQEKYLVIIPKGFFIDQTCKSTNRKKQEKTESKYTVFWRKIISDRKYAIDFTERFFSLNSTRFMLYETFGRLTLPPTAYADESYYQRIQNCNRDIYKAAFEGIQRRKNPNKIHFSALSNSGLAELLKNRDEVTLILLNYEKRKIFSSAIEENPTHIFENIFSEQHFKESKHFMYQNLFRRLFQKLQRNSIVLNPTSIDELAFPQQ